MTRHTIFDAEAVRGIRGLASLTEPGDDEAVGAIVDVPVIGARGDGKTQFIVHAIRTLRAFAPVLDGPEHQYNRDVLQVVMNARAPRPDATAPGVVPHYVFRIRPQALLSQIGPGGRLALLARAAGLISYLVVALANAAAVGAVLAWLRGGIDAVLHPAVIATAGGVFAIGAALGLLLARAGFVRRGNIEIVFWDVAGEHVYSDSAADYYSFLSALVRARRDRASASRSYAFAPVLICNPMSLGTRVEGSAYARLRQLIPMFASLNEPLPRALVAINRWAVVERVCAPDQDREDIVALVPQPRSDDDEVVHVGDPGDPAAGAGPDADGGGGDADRAAPPRALPVVKRDVVRAHCMDAEDVRDSEVDFSYLRYDAGIQCEFREQPWTAWAGATASRDGRAASQPPGDPGGQAARGAPVPAESPGAARSKWRAPTAAPDLVLDYIYEDGPGSFKGEVRAAFLRWIAGLAFHAASYGPAEADAPGRARRARDADDEPEPAVRPEPTRPRPGANAPDGEPVFVRAPASGPAASPHASAADTTAWAPGPPSPHAEPSSPPAPPAPRLAGELDDHAPWRRPPTEAPLAGPADALWSPAPPVRADAAAPAVAGASSTADTAPDMAPDMAPDAPHGAAPANAEDVEPGDSDAPIPLVHVRRPSRPAPAADPAGSDSALFPVPGEGATGHPPEPDGALFPRRASSDPTGSVSGGHGRGLTGGDSALFPASGHDAGDPAQRPRDEPPPPHHRLADDRSADQADDPEDPWKPPGKRRRRRAGSPSLDDPSGAAADSHRPADPGSAPAIGGVREPDTAEPPGPPRPPAGDAARIPDTGEARRRAGTAPGFARHDSAADAPRAAARATPQPPDPAQGRAQDPADDGDRARETLRMPGGFGSGGT